MSSQKNAVIGSVCAELAARERRGTERAVLLLSAGQTAAEAAAADAELELVGLRLVVGGGRGRAVGGGFRRRGSMRRLSGRVGWRVGSSRRAKGTAFLLCFHCRSSCKTVPHLAVLLAGVGIYHK